MDITYQYSPPWRGRVETTAFEDYAMDINDHKLIFSITYRNYYQSWKHQTTSFTIQQADINPKHHEQLWNTVKRWLNHLDIHPIAWTAVRDTIWGACCHLRFPEVRTNLRYLFMTVTVDVGDRKVREELEEEETCREGVRLLLKKTRADGEGGGAHSGCCTICLEDVAMGIDDEGDVEVTRLPCCHVFHEDCLVNWVLKGGGSSPSCPTCRFPLLDTGNILV